jgi:pimeloyl-ACP methyl ester carboxylesterase
LFWLTIPFAPLSFKMSTSLYKTLAAAFLLGSVQAKVCQDLTIPVTISARNAVFNLTEPTNTTQVTDIAQHFTRAGNNYTAEILEDYTTITGTYNISARYCVPSPSNSTANSTLSRNGTTLQFLTHGIGFDKTYWDIPYDNLSYTNVAVDQYGYSTLAIDRLGTGESSHADPIQVIQASAELQAIYGLTMMLRNGSISGIPRPSKIVHVGHSFGSILSYSLAATYPSASDGLILTGFSTDMSSLPATIANFNIQPAAWNQFARFGGETIEYKNPDQVLEQYGLLDETANLNGTNITAQLAPLLRNATGLYNTTTIQSRRVHPRQLSVQAHGNSTTNTTLITAALPLLAPAKNLSTGYITWSSASSLQFSFLAPPYYNTSLTPWLETTKAPFTIGELLTMGSAPMMARDFSGPVQVLTGEYDFIFCGGNCTVSREANSGGMTVPQMVRKSFPNVKRFEGLVQPGAGHAINVHYNATGAYVAVQEFLRSSMLSA